MKSSIRCRAAWHKASVVMLGAMLAACGESAPPEPQLSFEESLQQQLIQAEPGTVIEIPAGVHALTRSLSLTVPGVTIRGQGMAQSLRRKGYALRVFDLRGELMQDFVKEGGTACASPADAAGGCDVLISVVVNAAQTEAVLFGEHGAAAALPKGGVFVMCSTVDPKFSIDLEARLAERGILYLDAPISGGAAQAPKASRSQFEATLQARYTGTFEFDR